MVSYITNMIEIKSITSISLNRLPRIYCVSRGYLTFPQKPQKISIGIYIVTIYFKPMAEFEEKP